MRRLPVPGTHHLRRTVTRSTLLHSVRSPLRTPVGLAVAGVALTATLGGTTAWSMTGKTASVALDGDPRSVDFRGDRVEDVLEVAGLVAGPHDLVVPALDAPVEDGDSIVLRRGRQVELVVDGQTRTVWVTAASVEEALDQVGLEEDGLLLSASRSRSIPLEGLRLAVTTPKDVTVTVDGATTPHAVPATTVADLLDKVGVVLGALDEVSVPRETPVTDGLAIAVTRVVAERTTADTAIPFVTEKRDDADLTVGQTKTVEAGRTGLVRKTFDVRLVDGQERSRTLVSEERLREPVSRILAVGTKPKPKPAPQPAAATGSNSPSADGLNWGALAKCESGGNPRAVSPRGQYRGLYQFSLATWRSVGGQGDPIANSAGEQTYRAQILYKRSGAGQWPHCGKHLFT